MEVVVVLIILIFILYLVIKTAIDHSEIAQDIREIKQYLLSNSDNQKTELSLEVDTSDYEICPACNCELASDDTNCPSCGLFLGP